MKGLGRYSQKADLSRSLLVISSLFCFVFSCLTLLVPSGRYMKKYHIDCFQPKFGGWDPLDPTDDHDRWVLDHIEELRPEDQDRINAFYSGENKPKLKSSQGKKRKKKDSVAVEQAEEEAEADLDGAVELLSEGELEDDLAHLLFPPSYCCFEILFFLYRPWF